MAWKLAGSFTAVLASNFASSLLSRIGLYRAAEYCSQATLDKYPKFRSMIVEHRARLWQRCGDLAKAEAILLAEEKAGQADELTYWTLAEVLEQQGRRDEAADCYHRLLSLLPDASPEFRESVLQRLTALRREAL